MISLNFKSNHSQMFFKIGVLKNVHKKTPVLELLFNKVTDFEACNCLDRLLSTSCLNWKFKHVEMEIFKDTLFTVHLQMTATEIHRVSLLKPGSHL